MIRLKAGKAKGIAIILPISIMVMFVLLIAYS
jgi:hypothetical protein